MITSNLILNDKFMLYIFFNTASLFIQKSKAIKGGNELAILYRFFFDI